MEAVRFDNVRKEFKVRQTRLMKDAILGIAGHRGRTLRTVAVDCLSFTVSAGETVALLGHNGSGKSTSLKMMAGIVAPTSGVISARGRVAPLLELGSGFHPDLTGRENIYLNGAVLKIPRAEIRRRFDEIVDFSEIRDYLDTPVKFYSSGMFIRLGFSVAVNLDPDILLLDEVLAVGDAAFQEKSMQRLLELRREGRTIVLVTHSIDAAEQFCDRALVLSHGHLTYDGPVVEARAAYQASIR